MNLRRFVALHTALFVISLPAVAGAVSNPHPIEECPQRVLVFPWDRIVIIVLPNCQISEDPDPFVDPISDSVARPVEKTIGAKDSERLFTADPKSYAPVEAPPPVDDRDKATEKR